MAAGFGLKYKFVDAPKLTIMQIEIGSVKVATALADLRAVLIDVHQRMQTARLPYHYELLYEEAVEDARQARISYIDGDLDQACEKIKEAYEKIYKIPLPGPPIVRIPTPEELEGAV